MQPIWYSGIFPLALFQNSMVRSLNAGFNCSSSQRSIISNSAAAWLAMTSRAFKKSILVPCHCVQQKEYELSHLKISCPHHKLFTQMILILPGSFELFSSNAQMCVLQKYCIKLKWSEHTHIKKHKFWCEHKSGMKMGKGPHGAWELWVGQAYSNLWKQREVSCSM